MRFFGSLQRTSKPKEMVVTKEMDVELAQVIVPLYGAVLEKDRLEGIGCTAAESSLPFEKDIIKDALVRLARIKFTNPRQMSMLRAGYMHLASFQSDGGRPRKLWQRREDIEKTLEKHLLLHRRGLLRNAIEEEAITLIAVSAEMDELSREFDARAVATWESSDA